MPSITSKVYHQQGGDLLVVASGGAINIETGGELQFNGTALGAVVPSAAEAHAVIADPTGGGTVDTQARTAINAIIDTLQSFGMVALA